MNGTNRLYRSTSNAMLGGVASGISNCFNIDATITRIAFMLAMLFTSGGFFLVYLALWVLIPTAGSTASQPNEIIQENVNEMGAKFRSFAGSNSKSANAGTVASADASPGSTPAYDPSQSQAQIPQYTGQASQYRQGANPTWLIIIGAFFLLANFGFFRAIHWAMWWPILLIGLGVVLLSRRTQP